MASLDPDTAEIKPHTRRPLAALFSVHLGEADDRVAQVFRPLLGGLELFQGQVVQPDEITALWASLFEEKAHARRRDRVIGVGGNLGSDHEITGRAYFGSG